ncbi:uncharacterized protein LOC110982638 isoform X2 [Acanthaster planci]|uniref:Uncharacterized protein LOC110982638 isoform X2 n=1 Tax=Acanthaster planci TaxID=133434 RepID=A0A8B7YWM6_ACAPL|nr:uncharacterized protein LOC110982638 isoform X2 [Acanthaster planci]
MPSMLTWSIQKKRTHTFLRVLEVTASISMIYATVDYLKPVKMLLKRSGKISALLFVLWAATMLWVLDTRVNFTQRTLKDSECPCAVALETNKTSAAKKDTAGSSAKVKTRTVVKWLNYCKDGNTTVPVNSKADAPPRKPEMVPKQDGGRKQPDAYTKDRPQREPLEQKTVEHLEEQFPQKMPQQPEQQQQQREAQLQQQQQESKHQQQLQQEIQQQPQPREKQQQRQQQETQQQRQQPQQQEAQQQPQQEDTQQQHQLQETQQQQWQLPHSHDTQQQPLQHDTQRQQPQPPQQNEVDQQYQQQQSPRQQITAQEAARRIQQQQQQRSWEPSPADKVINPHPFHFLMKNSDACVKGANPDGYVDVLCLVYTAPSDSYMRSLIRKTWASAKEVKGKRIVTMFLLGQRNLEIQQLIELENNLYHDIIQEDFTDSYYNLTIKTIMGLKWASYYCSNARFIVKMDIDMFVNVYNLVDRIDQVPTSGLAEGNRKDVTKPIRYKQSKWYTSKDVYPEDSYPPYLNGPAYLISADLAARIYKESFTTQFLPWEDAFVGIIMKKIHVDPKYSGVYDTYLNYTDEQETLRKIGRSITFHLGEDKDKNKANIVRVWKYVQKLNNVTV